MAGKFLLVRHTAKQRVRATLRAIKTAVQKRQHHPLREQGRWLGSVMRGYFAYHAVPTNLPTLGHFRTQVARHWLRALRRRGQRRPITWERMNVIVNRWLPPPRLMHPA
jgi:hypothetical protein